jgi:hypothetical protein
LYIANRNSTGVISSIKQLSAENNLLFPLDFMVITEDPDIIKRDFITKNMEAFITVASMPSYNDDKGDVIILNAQGNSIDELQYDEKWHFKLIDNREGVALERIDYNAATQQQDNWHSAATSAGYGTPTYKNSQYKLNDAVKGTVIITPEIMSPDNDGVDDFATVSYTFHHRVILLILPFLMQQEGRCVTCNAMHYAVLPVITDGMVWVKKIKHYPLEYILFIPKYLIWRERKKHLKIPLCWPEETSQYNGICHFIQNFFLLLSTVRFH